MDVVTLALARKYADNKIQDLGTIQRLAGRVETVEDLENIENPQTGDVYIVGTKEQENSEYIFVGDEWEELGPMMNTDNLLTRTEYIEDITNRPTFEQANQMIDRAIYEAEDARVLKYVGHFADESSLPFTGQKSGVSTDYKPYTLTQNFINTSFDINKIRAIVSEPYFIGYYVSNTDYTLIGFTDKNSLKAIKFIPWVNRMSTTDRVSNIAVIEISIEGSATNQIKMYSYRSIQGRKTDVCYKNVDTNDKYQRDTPRTITFNADIYLYKVSNLCSNVTGTIFKYVLDKDGWLEIYAYDQPNGHSPDSKKELILQFADNFVYKENMAMLKFDANCQPIWLTTEGECFPNDVASYGEQRDYCLFDGENWTPMGMQSADMKEYVNTTINETLEPIDEMLDVIINGE